MKFTVIFIALMGVFFIWRFIPAAVELGLPTHPVYYIFAVIAVILGFLTHRFSRSNIAQRWPILTVLVFLVYIGITTGLYYTGIEILTQIGSSQFRYILSILGFEGFVYVKKLHSRKELNKQEEMLESASKGLFGMMIALLVACLPILVLALLAIWLLK